MSVEAWALFCLTELVLCLSPGPAALVVISQSLTRGPAAGIRVTSGVITANAIYFALSASGLVALHSMSAEAFAALKWTGAAYLAWLGISMVVRSLRASPPDPVRPARTGRPFWRGFVTQGANPNLLLYFTAILPQFIDARHAVAPQVLLLGCSSFAIEFSVLSAYAGLTGRARAAAAPRFRLVLQRVGGGLLVAAAAGLARLEREDAG